MFEFLVETYAEPEATNLIAAVEEAALAAEHASEAGTEVRLLHVILVPEDETCFYLYQSPTADAVREALKRARLRAERISQAVSIGPAPNPGSTPPSPATAHGQAPT
jgi:hypothetical protein